MRYALVYGAKISGSSSGRHQMINSLYYMVYVVYFYSVEKMGSFHYNPV